MLEVHWDFVSESKDIEQRHGTIRTITLIMLSQTLARQLEYYFSEANLSKDTYLQTLRRLNDGCVPLAIIANFAKVQALTNASKPEGRAMSHQDRQEAVLQAIKEHSVYLCIYLVDSVTGKVIPDGIDDSSVAPTATVNLSHSLSQDVKLPVILAVSTRDRKALSAKISVIQTAEVYSHKSTPVTNTLIFRDVDPNVNSDDIQSLLEQEVKECPRIISIQPDVAFCWYVVEVIKCKLSFIL